MLKLLRKSLPVPGLYDGLVTRARAPVFFREFGVADSIDGRFDMVALHAWLALKALQAGGHARLAQGLTDALFVGFDEAMREQGSSDMGLSRKMKAFADAFYGRMTAYQAALMSEGGAPDAMAQALARNLYRGAAVDDRMRRLAVYVLAAGESLAKSLPDGLDFGPLPSISGS